MARSENETPPPAPSGADKLKNVREQHEKTPLGRIAKACGLFFPSILMIQASREGTVGQWALVLGVVGAIAAVIWLIVQFTD